MFLFSKRPDTLWGPPGLQFSRYRAKECVVLYLFYLHYASSWRGQGRLYFDNLYHSYEIQWFIIAT